MSVFSSHSEQRECPLTSVGETGASRKAWATWATGTLGLALAEELGICDIFVGLSAASPPPVWAAATS